MVRNRKPTRQNTFRGRERPHFGLAFLGRNPLGLRGSLPATVSTEIRLFRACAASVSGADGAKNSWQLLPRFSGKSCQNSRARLARDSFRP
jgi:hypothetical protein